MRRGEFCTALILTLLGILVYNSNLRLISAGDNYPARYLPFGILKHGSVLLDPIAPIVSQGYAHPYWALEKYGHTFSRYPITVPVLVAPLYVPAVAYLNWRGWTDHRLERVARIMEKVVATIIAGVSVGFMYLLLVWRTQCQGALWLTIAYGFGTNTWMISSQALWQHGFAELLLVVSLFVLLGPCTASRSFWAGIILALIVSIRPPDAILVIALGLYGLRWAHGRVHFFLIGALVPLVLLLTYNLRVTHHVTGAYGIDRDLSLFGYNLSDGVLGLLFSPVRGLFIFSPFLLFLPFCLRYTLREARIRMLALLILVAIVAQVALYAKLDWRAGCAWGPRWLTDVLPLLVWLLAPGFGNLGRMGGVGFAVTTCLAIGIQVVGAFWYTGESDAVIMKADGDPNQMNFLWDFQNAPFIAELRHDLAPREIMLKVDGFIDRVKADGEDVDQIVPGTSVEIEGWALTDQHGPVVVSVSLVPFQKTKWRGPGQYPLVQTSEFLERPDVNQAMGGTGPTGWRVVLKTDGLDPGPHRFEVKAKGNKGGEYRPVASRVIRILPTQDVGTNTAVGIDAVYRMARDRLQARQKAEGYWLTAFTQSLKFDHPAFEMNTFTTSMIVDLLAPVSKAAGLDESLSRARRHLFQQIEPSGLVRYHGHADSSTIPSLGCIITPDADDTALAWRIGTGVRDDPRLAGALKMLKSYRTPEGLYRTWLAPKEQYVSIDPGQDPNPTDVGIQMNVLMFLAEVDPAAAKHLHLALQSAVKEDRIWVYYKKAPLMPLLREADLHKLGYPVCLPQNRSRVSVAGQEVWIETCQQLARYMAKGEPRPDPAQTRALLESLGKNNFSAIRSNPPLFYHNDLTAKVSRYYWSEDFGYALWLRLYLESSIGSNEKATTTSDPVGFHRGSH